MTTGHTETPNSPYILRELATYAAIFAAVMIPVTTSSYIGSYQDTNLRTAINHALILLTTLTLTTLTLTGITATTLAYKRDNTLGSYASLLTAFWIAVSLITLTFSTLRLITLT